MPGVIVEDEEKYINAKGMGISVSIVPTKEDMVCMADEVIDVIPEEDIVRVMDARGILPDTEMFVAGRGIVVWTNQVDVSGPAVSVVSKIPEVLLVTWEQTVVLRHK